MEFKRVFSKKIIVLFLFITLISTVMYYREQVKITDMAVEPETEEDSSQNGKQSSNNSNSIDGVNIKVDFDNTEVYYFYNLMLAEYREHVSELGSEAAVKSVSSKYSGYITLYTKMKTNTEDYEKKLESIRRSVPSIYEAYMNYLENDPDYLTYIYESKNIIAAANTQLISDEQYIRNYNDTIKAKRSQVDQLMKNGLYSGENSFSRLNILKARYDIKKLETITPEVGNGKAIETIFEYDLINYLLVILIVATIYTFFDERKKGLWSIIHNSAGGRYRLTAKRTGILFGLSFLYTFGMYVATFAAAFKLYGGFGDLRQLIQSGQKYEVVLLVMSRWKFILVFLAAHSICLFVIGIMIWIILSLIKNSSVSMLITGLIFAVEYIAYALVPANSALCVFKYVNLFQLICPASSFTKYLNWGYGSFIVDTQTSTIILATVLLPICIIVNTLINGRKRPIEKVGMLENALQIVSSQIAKGVERLPVFLKEIYKVLFIQKGIIILVVAVWLVLDNQIARGVMYDDAKTEMSNFYKEADGLVPGPEVDSIIAAREAELADLKENHNTTKEENDLINMKESVLKEIKSNVSYLSELKEKRGIEGKITNPYVYEDVLGKRLNANQRNVGITAVFTVILLIFGTFAFEKKQAMVPVLRSSGGRNKLWRLKILSVIGTVAIIWLLLYGINGWNITRIYKFNSLSVPLQSLKIMGDFPISMSIGTFLVLLNIYKFILLLCIGFMVMAVSSRIDYFRALIVSCIILVGHILYVLGIKVFYLTSSVIPISFTEFWSQYGNNWRSYITAAVIIILGITAHVTTRRKWNRTR